MIENLIQKQYTRLNDLFCCRDVNQVSCSALDLFQLIENGDIHQNYPISTFISVLKIVLGFIHMATQR